MTSDVYKAALATARADLQDCETKRQAALEKAATLDKEIMMLRRAIHALAAQLGEPSGLSELKVIGRVGRPRATPSATSPDPSVVAPPGVVTTKGFEGG